MLRNFPACAITTLRSFIALLVPAMFALGSAADAALPTFDFTGSTGAQGWAATHDIAALTPSRDGLVVKIAGSDAFMHSPRGDFSASGQLIFTATLRSPEAGWGQVYFSKDTDSETLSTWFAVREGWNDVCVPLPPMGAGWRLRLDFPAKAGECVLARAGVEIAGERGVSAVRMETERVVLALRGLSGPIEIAEIEPHQTHTDAANARVVWKGDAAGEVIIPRNDGAHDRLASGFVALVPHAVRVRVPAGAVRYAESFAGIAKDARAFPKPDSKKGIQVQMADDALALGIRHATLNVSVEALFDWEKKDRKSTRLNSSHRH